MNETTERDPWTCQDDEAEDAYLQQLRQEQDEIDQLLAYGHYCPGWHTPPHPATDLCTDHVIAKSRQALTVLCRSCNSRKSVQER